MADVDALYDATRGLFFFAQLAVGAAIGVPLGNSLADVPWWQQSFLAASITILAAWALAWVIAGIDWAFVAPVRQRDETQNALSEMEAEGRRIGHVANDLNLLVRLMYCQLEGTHLKYRIAELDDPLPDRPRGKPKLPETLLRDVKKWVSDCQRVLRDAGHNDFAARLELRAEQTPRTAGELATAFDQRYVLVGQWALRNSELFSPPEEPSR